MIIILPAIWASFTCHLLWFVTSAKRNVPITLGDAKTLWKFTRKILNAPATNGALSRVKVGKYLALNASADTNTHKGGRYYLAVLETSIETIEAKRPFQLHPTNQLYFNERFACI